MKIDFRLTAITILLVGVLYLAVDFNSQINKFHQNYLQTIKKLYILDNSWKTHLDILKESLIAGKFNNDILVKHNKKNEDFNKMLLEDEIIKKNYPRVYKNLKKYSEHRIELKNLTNQFMMINAKIKNSMSILNKKLTSLESDNKLYFDNYVKIVTELNDMKNSFDQEYRFSKDLLEFFQNNQEKNNVYKLQYIHIKLLHNEIPKLHKIFSKITNHILPTIIEESFEILEEESQKKTKWNDKEVLYYDDCLYRILCDYFNTC